MPREAMWSPQMRKWSKDAHRHGMKLTAMEYWGAGGSSKISDYIIQTESGDSIDNEYGQALLTEAAP